MYADFHESYYEHGCSIVPEKDVLQIDIQGSTCLAIIKRWWYNLFLLSYTNKRNIIYYNSSHAMKVERTRHFRRYRDCIHPLSVFKNFWDGLFLHALLLNKLIFHHTSSLIYAELPIIFYFIGVALEIIIIFDIYVNVKSGYIDEITKKVVLDLRKALEHYCSTKLFLHVAASTPVHSLMFLRYGMDVKCIRLCKGNKFMGTLAVLNVFSWLRFIEASTYWDRDKKTYRATCFFKLLRICILAYVTMFQFHSIMDAISLLSYLNSNYMEPRAYYSLVVFVKYNLQHLSNWEWLTYSINRTFKALILFNFGHSNKRYHIDKLTDLIAFCIANLFFFWGMIEVFSYVTRETYPEDQIITNKTAGIRLAKTRRLPDKCCSKLQHYFNFNMSWPLMVEKYNGLYKSLPFTLKKEIMLHSHSRLLTRIPYFSEWPINIIEAFVMLLKEEIFLKQDVVAEAGVAADGLSILVAGMLAVYSSEHKEMGHLIDGDYFGELSLVTDKEMRTSYVVAVTNCKIIVLEKTGFRKFMREHPDLFFEMKEKLLAKYKQGVGLSQSATKADGRPRIEDKSP